MQRVVEALRAEIEQFFGKAAIHEVARLQEVNRQLRNSLERRRGNASDGPLGTPGRPVGRARELARLILTSRPDISYASALQYLILYDRVEWAAKECPHGGLQMDKVPEPSSKEAECLKRALDAEWPSTRWKPRQLPRGYYRYKGTGGRLTLLEALDSPSNLTG